MISFVDVVAFFAAFVIVMTPIMMCVDMAFAMISIVSLRAENQAAIARIKFLEQTNAAIMIQLFE